MDKKTFFFDIDGTLIDSYHGKREMSTATLSELRRLKENGHRLFISTGRPKALLPKDILSFGFDGFIFLNGGHVELGDEAIFKHRMDEALVTEICDTMEEMSCEYMIETANHVYIDKHYDMLYKAFINFLDGVIRREFDRAEVLKRCIKIEAVANDDTVMELCEKLEKRTDLSLKYDKNGTDNLFEFFSPEINKSVGVEKILSRLSINKDSTYAFGDGSNDIEMLEFCHTGIAMGNAATEVKSHGDLVIGTVAEDGVAKFLREHLS